MIRIRTGRGDEDLAVAPGPWEPSLPPPKISGCQDFLDNGYSSPDNDILPRQENFASLHILTRLRQRGL